ncbi:hypothetical protein B0H67DRAFT_139734 [Lasiosphaeris hirsuta]|uniref:Uncharacterized protein n=1 Tax=Lasiosphaeris hirsuta TaxID=260670 RepID=A0AA40B1A1_9PEZI|nr:hypothetical protein B0H67DRAFT_139734 [Lasiosphaeris hirsuta]
MTASKGLGPRGQNTLVDGCLQNPGLVLDSREDLRASTPRTLPQITASTMNQAHTEDLEEEPPPPASQQKATSGEKWEWDKTVQDFIKQIDGKTISYAAYQRSGGDMVKAMVLLPPASRPPSVAASALSESSRSRSPKGATKKSQPLALPQPPELDNDTEEGEGDGGGGGDEDDDEKHDTVFQILPGQTAASARPQTSRAYEEPLSDRMLPPFFSSRIVAVIDHLYQSSKR